MNLHNSKPVLFVAGSLLTSSAIDQNNKIVSAAFKVTHCQLYKDFLLFSVVIRLVQSLSDK
jgi:hypothetical protein